MCTALKYSVLSTVCIPYSPWCSFITDTDLLVIAESSFRTCYWLAGSFRSVTTALLITIHFHGFCQTSATWASLYVCMTSFPLHAHCYILVAWRCEVRNTHEEECGRRVTSRGRGNTETSGEGWVLQWKCQSQSHYAVCSLAVIATRLWAGWPRNQGLISGRGSNFSPLPSVQTTDSGSHPASCPVGTRGCFTRSKMTGMCIWPLTYI
jgi:hypothetical protein